MLHSAHDNIHMYNLYGVNDQWNPVLVYHKPPFERARISKNLMSDDIESDSEYSNTESYFIEMLSLPKETVLDPMMGKGQVLKSSKMLKRKCIGIDIDSYCVKTAIRNLKKLDY